MRACARLFGPTVGRTQHTRSASAPRAFFLLLKREARTEPCGSKADRAEGTRTHDRIGSVRTALGGNEGVRGRRRRRTAWLHLPATTRTFKKEEEHPPLAGGGARGGGGGAARQVVFSRSADRLMGSSRRSSPARCVRALPPFCLCAS